MAENTNANSAQAKLGELFVELGTKGSGGVIGTLNKVSAQFLLTKNAAEQAIKPFINFSKQGGNLAQTFNKINATTGLTNQQLQHIRNTAKATGSDFNAILSSMEQFQQNMIQLSYQGAGSLNKLVELTGLQALTELDLDKPFESLQKITKEIMQFKDESARAFAMQQLGISPELLYFFEKMSTTGYNIGLNVDEKGFKNLQAQQDQWNRIALTWEQLGAKFLSQSDAWLNALTSFANALDKFASWVIQSQKDAKDPKKQEEKAKKTIDNLNKYGYNIRIPGQEGLPLGFAAPIAMNEGVTGVLPELNRTSSVDNRQIIINQTINGADAQQVANETISILTQQDLDITEFANRIVV